MSRSSKKWILTSSDKETFEVEEAVASESVTIKDMIDEFTDENTIILPNVKGNTLAKVIEYCKKHIETPPKSGADADAAFKAQLKKFDEEFVKLDWDAHFDLVLAANYLNIAGLLDVTCQAIADRIKDLMPDEIRKIFNIENDFTKEEEEALKNEHAWAFEV
ncbi:hypothetical protein V2J09_008329 [Rumex salicifolius]